MILRLYRKRQNKSTSFPYNATSSSILTLPRRRFSIRGEFRSFCRTPTKGKLLTIATRTTSSYNSQWSST
ncbi:unnamed protein product, partial [Nesidiocoris tenuis]